MFKRILVPLDGSQLSHQSLPYAKRIARCGGSELVLLRATPRPASIAMTPEDVAVEIGERPPSPGVPFQPSPADRVFTAAPTHLGDVRVEREVQQAAEELDTLQSQLRSEGLAVSTVVRPGEAADAILDVGREVSADLVVMSTHGRGGVSRFLLGSVADKVVRHAEIPVMLVRARDVHAEAPEFKRIMVPLDGSLAAAEILPSVRELARCSGSEIVLLRVVPGEPESQIADARLPPTTRVEKTEVTGERAATDYVQTLSTSAVHWGVPVRTLVQVGDPASVILDTAQDMYADLIAMSTHGLGGLRRFFLGSVAERVVRHAVAPVMLFRAKE